MWNGYPHIFLHLDYPVNLWETVPRKCLANTLSRNTSNHILVEQVNRGYPPIDVAASEIVTKTSGHWTTWRRTCKLFHFCIFWWKRETIRVKMLPCTFTPDTFHHGIGKHQQNAETWKTFFRTYSWRGVISRGAGGWYTWVFSSMISESLRSYLLKVPGFITFFYIQTLPRLSESIHSITFKLLLG